jgi:hypothetical protein
MFKYQHEVRRIGHEFQAILHIEGQDGLRFAFDLGMFVSEQLAKEGLNQVEQAHRSDNHKGKTSHNAERAIDALKRY